MLRKYIKNISGNIAMSTAIFAVPLLSSAGVAIDYARVYQAEAALQQAADSAALASAKELGLTKYTK